MGISTLHLYHPFLFPSLTPSRRPPRKLRKITNHHLLPPALRRLNNPRPILKIQLPIPLLKHILVRNRHARRQPNINEPLKVRTIQQPRVHRQNQILRVIHRAAEQRVRADEVRVRPVGADVGEEEDFGCAELGHFGGAAGEGGLVGVCGAPAAGGGAGCGRGGGLHGAPGGWKFAFAALGHGYEGGEGPR
jgi:hypothetical protein